MRSTFGRFACKEFSLYLKYLLSVLAFITPAFTRSLSFTIALTLCTEVIAQHRTEDKVLFGRQFVERTGDNETNGIETFLATNVEIQVVLASRL